MGSKFKMPGTICGITTNIICCMYIWYLINMAMLPYSMVVAYSTYFVVTIHL